MITGCWDNSARLFDLTTGENLCIIENDDLVDFVKLSPCGNSILINNKNTAKLIDLYDNRTIIIIEHANKVTDANFSPNG